MPEPLTSEQLKALHAIAVLLLKARRLVSETRSLNERSSIPVFQDDLMGILREVALVAGRGLE